MNISTVTIVGANGAMGRNIAGIFASFGNARVYLVSREIEKSRQAIGGAGRSVRAETVTARMIPADYAMLENCVRESDLIFESVREDMQTKTEVTGKIAAYARDDAICCTGTSGLSVTALAECFP
ncbi:MAG: 3-hydroxyacyl-CoA dehydrogenase NAD-binding domain-containing protein, partial [Oscillospiraceae bacterium]|nr:3-hydroxyacyl-CoA dehydrogenase NAD-binding domain-containing protein [Oscillospiraceae bacterium]